MNPVAAQFSGEAHIPNCSFYIAAQNAQRGFSPLSRAKYFGAKSDTEWMKVNDVKDGEILTVKSFEEITNSLGKRPCLWFEEKTKALTLNQTNYDFFMEHFGENEMDWEGRQVVVSIEMAKNPQEGNRMQPAIRFKKVSATKETKKKK
jgi:hypothetical protein